MHVARKEYLQNKKGIILLQCCVRRMAARKELKRLKVTYNVFFFLKYPTKLLFINFDLIHLTYFFDKRQENKIMKSQNYTVFTKFSFYI